MVIIAWEFNYLVDVKDENDQKIRVCIDAKFLGNYLRFSNHRDSKLLFKKKFFI
jgi:hypothetical protein